MHGGTSAAISLGGQNFSPRQKYVPDNDNTLAAELSNVLRLFSVGQIARAAGCCKDTAKAYKKGRALPNAGKLIILAQNLPPVGLWLEGKIDPNKRKLAEMTLLQQQAMMPGEEGAEARAKMVTMFAERITP